MQTSIVGFSNKDKEITTNFKLSKQKSTLGVNHVWIIPNGTQETKRLITKNTINLLTYTMFDKYDKKGYRLSRNIFYSRVKKT